MRSLSVTSLLPSASAMVALTASPNASAALRNTPFIAPSFRTRFPPLAHTHWWNAQERLRAGLGSGPPACQGSEPVAARRASASRRLAYRSASAGAAVPPSMRDTSATRWAASSARACVMTRPALSRFSTATW